MLGIQVTRGKQLLCAKEIKEFRATKNVNSSFFMNEYILDFCTSSFNWLLFPPKIQSSIVESDHLIKQFSYTDVQSLILNQPVNFKNWSTLFHYLAFHCTFCDSKYVVGRKFLLSNFYRRKRSQRIKNDVSATFRDNIYYPVHIWQSYLKKNLHWWFDSELHSLQVCPSTWLKTPCDLKETKQENFEKF